MRKLGATNSPAFLPAEAEGWMRVARFPNVRHNRRQANMVISDDILASAHVSEAEVRSEIALALFAQDRLTLAQAARLADLPQLDFQALLAERKIPIHYDVADLEQDLRTLERLAAR